GVITNRVEYIEKVDRTTACKTGKHFTQRRYIFFYRIDVEQIIQVNGNQWDTHLCGQYFGRGSFAGARRASREEPGRRGNTRVRYERRVGTARGDLTNARR